MKKITFSTALILGGLLLAGGGCNIYKSTNTTPAATPATKTSSSPVEISSKTTGDFTILAELAGTKEVKVTWNTPANLADGSVIRLMHSSADNPTLPVPENGRAPYWYQPGPTRSELDWGGIPAGTRYFRACEFKDNACLRHSNTIMLEVK